MATPEEELREAQFLRSLIDPANGPRRIVITQNLEPEPRTRLNPNPGYGITIQAWTVEGEVGGTVRRVVDLDEAVAAGENAYSTLVAFLVASVLRYFETGAGFPQTGTVEPTERDAGDDDPGDLGRG